MSISIFLILSFFFLPLQASDSQSQASPDRNVTLIRITAKKYEFTPSEVTVRTGQRIRIEATALDRTHGLEIKEFGVKAKLEKGKMTVLEFTAERAGTFEIKCSEFCGLGHHGMKGKLIVVEPPVSK